jgi:hypothetical protein
MLAALLAALCSCSNETPKVVCVEGTACGNGVCHGGVCVVEQPSCPQGCATPREECIANACTPVLTSIAIVEPIGDGTFPAMVPVAAELGVTPGATTALPAQVTLSYQLVGAETAGEIALTKVPDKARYEGELVATVSGTYELTARTPAEYGDLVSSKRSIFIDAEPPTLTVEVHYPQRDNAPGIIRIDPAPSIGASYVRRDENVAITVSADEEIDASHAELLVVDAAGNQTSVLLDELPAPEGAPTCDTSKPFCKVIGLEMWRPELKLPAARGHFTLQAKARDTAGNQGASSEVSVAVSRFKWSAQIGGPLATSPAVSADGNVVVAIGSGTVDHARVRAIDPEATAVADVAQLNGLDPERLFLTSQAAGAGNLPTIVVGGKLKANAPSNSSAVLVINQGTIAPVCPGEFTEAKELALMRVGTESFVVALVDASFLGTSRVAAAAISAPGTCVVSADSFYASPHPGIAVNGSVVYLPGASALNSYTLNAGSFTMQSLDSGIMGQHLGPIVTRLGLEGIVTNPVGSDGETGSLFLAPGDGTLPVQSSGYSMVLRGLVSGSRHELVASSSHNSLLVFPDTLESAGTERPVSGPLSTWASIGANGTVFAVTDAGVLEAQGADESWTFALDGTLGSLSAFSPALDCARKVGFSVQGRAGVAYVGTQGGALLAIITDSPGLDSSSAASGAAERLWPKWAHDAQNTANADTSLSSNSCR